MSTNYLGMRAFRYNDADTGERVVFYRHPNGQKIKREVRDWNAYGVLGGQAGTVIDPKVSWVVYVGKRSVESFRTLRAAKAWCDTHPRVV